MEFADGKGEVFPVVVTSTAGANIRFAASQFVPDATDWDYQDWGGWLTISGNTLKLARCSISLRRSTGVGNGVYLVGYNTTTNVTAVWRIV